MTMHDEVIAGTAQLLDVRSSEEWAGGHAENALHIPIESLLKGETDALKPEKKIYVYCLSGGRAGLAATYLKGEGFDAESIGGLATWLETSKLK
jgi:rhodanese-related sulfurtransferase